MNREAGILLHISSLPSKYGIGCFSKEAYDFVDWLKEAGQTYWQILPVGPTSYGDSPYQSFSTFAGNPYFISLEALIEEGVLTEEECDAVDFGDNPTDIDYAKMYENRYLLLRKAYERSDISKNPDYQKFMFENSEWIHDYSLFMAVKNFFGGKAWSLWPEDISLRWNNALDYYRRELYFDIEFQSYMQFKFYEQYTKLKAYANENGIRIVGDIPIYVAMDSADTWASPELFQLDEENVPVAVAGCPPDAFTADGQLWGNPLYRWDYHKETGYKWWIKRLKYCFKMYDVTRIDHFRGFDEYYSIPYGDKNAKRGHWEKGPGMELFKKLTKEVPEHNVIAEDLGLMTDTVRKLVKDSDYPNMKVLQFAFDDSGADNEYLPHNYFTTNCVVYTGTHDNETLYGWFDGLTKEQRDVMREYLCDTRTPNKYLCKSLIAMVMRSVAKICILPIQDYLGLDNTARINFPSTIGTNWRWRLAEGELSEDIMQEVFEITARYGRLNKANQPEPEEETEEAEDTEETENTEEKTAEAAEKTVDEAETVTVSE